MGSPGRRAYLMQRQYCLCLPSCVEIAITEGSICFVIMRLELDASLEGIDRILLSVKLPVRLAYIQMSGSPA